MELAHLQSIFSESLYFQEGSGTLIFLGAFVASRNKRPMTMSTANARPAAPRPLRKLKHGQDWSEVTLQRRDRMRRCSMQKILDAANRRIEDMQNKYQRGSSPPRLR